MNEQQYIKQIIQNRQSTSLSYNDARLTDIKNVIKAWAGSQLSEIKLSGSCAKNTAIQGKSDCDLFISLKASGTKSLREIYYALNSFIQKAGYRTRLQNISISVITNGLTIDLIPAKVDEVTENYHNLYLSQQDSWTKTNVDLHTNEVLQTGRQEEIIATKIWGKLHNLTFPSVYLEMVVIYVLKHCDKNQAADNFLAVLEYLRDDFIYQSFVDYSNSSNIVSKLVCKYQKEEIRVAARKSLEQNYWENIIW